MELLRAVVLGIVQGLSEFLPISSSGHLVLVPALFRWPDQGLSFDVGLHLGTLVALLTYFWREWYTMFTVGVADFQRHGLRFSRHRVESHLLWLIALGSVPTAIVGLLFESWFEDNVRQPWVIALTLAIFGVVMLVADRYGARERAIASLNLRDALAIGAAQAVALIPGVSRSGATMSMGLFRGLTRDTAARFAFLLGTPAFVGAALLKSSDLGGEASADFAYLAVGFTCSAITGFVVIHFLLRYLRTRSLLVFVVYRWAIAVLTLVIGAARVA